MPEVEPASLVEAGTRYLDAGAWTDAVEVLDLALEARPGDVEGHLLLARALAEVRVEAPDTSCDWGAWPETIEPHLVAAAALRPDVRERVFVEPELEPVRTVLEDSVRLRLWALGDRAVRNTGVPTPRLVAGLPVLEVPSRLKGRYIRDFVVASTWYHLGDRDHALALFPGGSGATARVHRDLDGEKHVTYGRARWVRSGDVLWLTPDVEQAVTLRYHVTPEGLVPMNEGPAWGPWPAPCSRPFDVWAGLAR